jgi:hypothetical protein
MSRHYLIQVRKPNYTLKSFMARGEDIYAGWREVFKWADENLVVDEGHDFLKEIAGQFHRFHWSIGVSQLDRLEEDQTVDFTYYGEDDDSKPRYIVSISPITLT